MKNLLFLLGFFSCGCFISNAQTLQTELKDEEWRIIPGMCDRNPLFSSAGDFKLSRMYISSNEIAVLTGYRKDEFSVMLVNSQMKILWDIPLKGVPMAMGKFHDKLLVITTPGYKSLSSYKNHFDGTLIDPAKGNIILTKNLYDSENDYYTHPFFLFDKSTGDFRLGVRLSEIKKGIKILAPFGIGAGKQLDNMQKKLNQTRSMSLISFSGDLDIINTLDFAVENDWAFIDCINNQSGDMFTAYYEGGNKLLIEKFNAEGTTLKDTMELSFDALDKSDFNADIFTSQKSNDIVYVTIDYTNSKKSKTLGVYKIDFAKRNISSDNTAIDDDYKNTWKKNYVPLSDSWSKLLTEEWHNLKFADIIEYNDRVIVFKEVSNIGFFSTMNGGYKGYHNTADGILTIYDSQMHRLYEQVIGKTMMSYDPDFTASSSVHLEGNKLFICSASSTKKMRHPSVFFIMMDLVSDKIEKFSYLDRKKIKSSYSADPKSTLWFNDGFVANYVTGQGGLTVNRMVTISQKFIY